MSADNADDVMSDASVAALLRLGAIGPEKSHAAADDLLVKLLRHLGYAKTAEAFKAIAEQ